MSPSDEFLTELEIKSQPRIWRKWGRKLPTIARDVRKWISECDPAEIWLSGAGSSAYIGQTLEAGRDKDGFGRILRVVPSTDLVSRPDALLPASGTQLVVSFGRSGNMFRNGWNA